MGRLVIGTRKGKSVVYMAAPAALKDLGVAIGKLTPRR